MKENQHPWIIAHRGARDEAPENSQAALIQALRYAVDGVEFDVQMSSDGVPLLYHDRTLLKVGGGRKRVADLACSDLKRIDWGRWFHKRFSAAPLTTLEKALSLLRDCPNICIEIKSRPVDQASGHSGRLTEKVLSMVHKPGIRHLKNRILILSFDPRVLDQASQSDGNLRYVLNLSKKSPMKTVTATQHLWGVGVRISKLSGRLAQWARQRNLRLLTYTCNGPRQVKKALQLGVDAIITDRPGWLCRHLGRH